ncbi:MAG: hypothetical protein ACLQVD_11525 [Capsulimonadaceae bacterium]
MMRKYVLSIDVSGICRLWPAYLVVAAFVQTSASAQSINILRPVANSIVREQVPIKVSPRDVPPDGYVTIGIDNDVVVAHVLPEVGKPIFIWDTKAPYVTADDPTTKKYVSDGSHQLTVTIYGAGSKLVGTSTVPVRVANKIALGTQGVWLNYKWKLDEDLRYHRSVTVTQVVAGGGGNGGSSDTQAAAAPVQQAPVQAAPFQPGMGAHYVYGRDGQPLMGPNGMPLTIPGPSFGSSPQPSALMFSQPSSPAQAAAPVYNSGGDQILQSADVSYDRTVNDDTSGVYLIRDQVRNDGYVCGSDGTPHTVQSVFNIKGKYRTVFASGEVISTMPPLGPGDHFAFPIPELPGRRVNVGDSWRVPMRVSLDWASSDPMIVSGEARLEDFEWQNGYPTAKIRETYSGPARFPNSSGAKFAGAPVDNVTVTQILYFAYNSGRLVRSEQNADMTVELTGPQQSNLNPFSGSQGDESGGQGGFPFGAPGMSGGSTDSGGPTTPMHLKVSETTDLIPGEGE